MWIHVWLLTQYFMAAEPLTLSRKAVSVVIYW